MFRSTLGLMTTDLPHQQARRRTSDATWRLLAEAGREEGVTVVFFHPHDVSLPDHAVQGQVFHPETGWLEDTFALPSVIVDNVFVHIARSDSRYAAIKRALKKRGITFLNPRLPDKWGVWRALLTHEQLRDHLPHTALLQKASDVHKWLERYPSVFLKPVRGSGGRGVMQVQKAEDGTFFVQDQETRQVSEEELLALLDDLLFKEKHLVQRDLHLLEVDDCKIDLRCVLHRDGHGRWQPIATVPRLGEPGQAVTNLAQGGQVRSLEWLRERAHDLDLFVPSREEIERVARLAAEAVTAIRPRLAFLGIDIALDQQGHLWTIDVNPRPGRKVLQPDDRKAAFRCLVAYAERLLQEH